MLELPHYFAVTASSTEEKAVSSLLRYGEPRILQDCKTHSYDTSAKLWIAGGITPQNAAELAARFKPELIDVSGGIEDESLPGIKNPEKMKQFFANLKRI